MNTAVGAGARRRGSWPWLLAALAAFWLALAALRARSPFLAIERDRAAARAVAAAAGIGLADALALRDLVGAEAPSTRWQEAAREFAGGRARLGDALAAVAVAGEPAFAERSLAAAGGEAALAWARSRSDPAALAGLRFLALRERFASRLPNGDRGD